MKKQHAAHKSKTTIPKKNPSPKKEYLQFPCSSQHRNNTCVFVSWRQVRVIAVVERSETLVYRCLFRCQGQLHTSEGHCGIHSDHFGFKYGTGDIMCPLPSGCEAPSHIALASAALEGNETFCTSSLKPC